MHFRNSLFALLACLLVTACASNNQRNADTISPEPSTTVPVQADQSGDISNRSNSAEALQATAPSQSSSEASRSSDGLQLDQGSSLAGEVSDLNGLVTDLNGKVTDTEIIVELPADVLFDFDKADIREDAVSTLDKVVRLIRTAESDRIQINGHTDSKGSDTYNMALSQRRAESVQLWLVDEGSLNSSHFQTVGYGETQPIADNELPDGTDNPEGRAKNRRVEVVISTK